MRRIALHASVIGALAAAVGVSAAAGWAQDPEALVRARRDHMRAQTAAMSAIKAYLRDEADQVTAQKNADDLVKLVRALPDEFPPGTSTAEFPGESGAMPAIWSEKDKFSAAERAVVTAAEKLAAAIKSGDKKAVADQYMNVAWNGCNSCHTNYRLRLN